MDLDKIKFVIEEHKQSPGKRTAQHLLAHNFVALVHGAEEAKTAQQQHRASFGRSEESTEESLAAFKMREDKKFLPRSEVIGQLVDKVLYNAGIVTSRSKARNLLDSDGFKVYRKFSSSDPLNPGLAFCFENPRGKDRFIEISEDWLLDGNILVFKIGKNKIRTIELTE